MKISAKISNPVRNKFLNGANGVKKIFLVFFISLLFLSFAAFIQAAGLVPCGPGTAKPTCELCDFFVMFKNWIDRFLFTFVPIIAILMISIGGFMYIVAYLSPTEILTGGQKGGPALFSQAKRLFTSVVFGLIIIYGAWLIINIFFQAIGINEFNEFKTLPQNWWRINCE